MFTKTLLSLALILGTASNALAATKHSAASSHRNKDNAWAMEMRRDRTGFVAGNMIFVGLHEIGHALVDQLRVPLLGRSEDAADSFATLVLLEEGSEFSISVLVQTARGLFLAHTRDRKLGEALDFSDAHGLDRQRAFQIICLMVGSDGSKFKDLANWVRLPVDRRESCRADYDDAKRAWQLVLTPHLRSADQPRAKTEVAYQQGDRQIEDYKDLIRSVGYLEALAEHLSGRYLLPRPVRLVMMGCGAPKAWWNPAAVTASFCYELVEDFSDLYQGYAMKSMSQWNMQVSLLTAGNASPVHPTSKGNTEAGGTAPEAGTIRNPLRRLALDLEGGAPALFTQVADRQSTMHVRPRASKN